MKTWGLKHLRKEVNWYNHGIIIHLQSPCTDRHFDRLKFRGNTPPPREAKFLPMEISSFLCRGFGSKKATKLCRFSAAKKAPKSTGDSRLVRDGPFEVLGSSRFGGFNIERYARLLMKEVIFLNLRWKPRIFETTVPDSFLSSHSKWMNQTPEDPLEHMCLHSSRMLQSGRTQPHDVDTASWCWMR